MTSARSTSPAQSADSSPRSTSQRRISQPSSPRLATISEGASAAPPVPRRSSRRISHTPGHRLGGLAAWGSQSTVDTGRTAPPAYDWVPEPVEGTEDGNSGVDGEKPTLSRDKAFRTSQAGRGGWGRVLLIGGLVLLLLVALAVGLGVGLGEDHNNSKNSSGQSSGQSPPSSPGADVPPQKFPLGQYSFVTALTTIETNCTSNAATWRCYPFTVFDPSVSSTTNTSMATFDWVINNTESSYATASSSKSNTPANLTVSTTANPFDLVSFSPQALTYIASSSNASSARYTFTLTVDKKVIPSPAITSNNKAAVCFFNQTTFTGNIYLSAKRNYPAGAEANSAAIGGFEQWPYAVEILQSAAGGDNVPNCYETVDGVVGAPITTGITALPASDECLCEYRNY